MCHGCDVIRRADTIEMQPGWFSIRGLHFNLGQWPDAAPMLAGTLVTIIGLMPVGFPFLNIDPGTCLLTSDFRIGDDPLPEMLGA